MKRITLIAALLVSAVSFAAAKTYQVTGPVEEVRDDVIVVMKGKDKWEINKGAAKIDGELKKGTKVTVTYTMTVDSVEVKDAKPAAKK